MLGLWVPLRMHLNHYDCRLHLLPLLSRSSAQVMRRPHLPR
jgi:hypothetical protein